MEKEWLEWHQCSTVGTAQGCMGSHGSENQTQAEAWEVLKAFKALFCCWGV